jgi:hypothetical protein
MNRFSRRQEQSAPVVVNFDVGRRRIVFPKSDNNPAAIFSPELRGECGSSLDKIFLMIRLECAMPVAVRPHPPHADVLFRNAANQWFYYRKGKDDEPELVLVEVDP